MTSKCKHPKAPVPYPEFDNECAALLKNPSKAHSMLNASYCVAVSTELISIDADGRLILDDILKPLGKKIGVYHLWHPCAEKCDVCGIYRVECAYVGKGEGNVRPKVHLAEKYVGRKMFIMTFHECKNSLAKFYEQVFLETYKFDLNVTENTGTKPLYGYWDDMRFSVGTEGHRSAEEYAMREHNLGYPNDYI